MLKNKFIKDTSIYVISDLLNKAVPFLLLPILTRYLTPSDYGIISIFLVFIGLLGVFVSIESKTAISVFFFKKEHHQLKIFITNVLLLTSVLTSIVLILLIIFSPIVTKLLALSIEWIILGVFVTITQFITTVNIVLWQSERKPLSVGIYQIAQTVINLGLSLVLIVSLKMGLEGRLIAISFASIIFGIYSLYLLLKRNYLTINYNKDSIKETLSFGIPLIPHALSVWSRTGIDRVFLTAFVSTSATGMYTVAFQIASILYIFCVAFNKAYAPFLYKKLANLIEVEKVKLVRYTYLYFLSLLFFALILSLTAPFIVELFLGSSFYDSLKYISLLSFSFAFQGMYIMIVNYILFVKKTAYLSYVSLSISLFHIGLSYLLIKLNGTLGAAQATLISSITTFLCVWWLSNKVHKMPWNLLLATKKNNSYN